MTGKEASIHYEKLSKFLSQISGLGFSLRLRY